MYCIKQHCYIDAAPDKVMAHIRDFAAYPTWNPWIISAVGEDKVGSVVTVQAKLGKKVASYQHQILAVSSPSTFHWCDKGWFTIFAYGERIRHCHAQGAGTLYQVELRVSGIAYPLVRLLYGKALQEGLVAETQALKEWAEQFYESQQ